MGVVQKVTKTCSWLVGGAELSLQTSTGILQLSPSINRYCVAYLRKKNTYTCCHFKRIQKCSSLLLAALPQLANLNLTKSEPRTQERVCLRGAWSPY